MPRLVAAGVSAAWGLSPCRSRDEVEALLAGVEQAFPNLAEDCQRLRHLHGG